MNFHKSESRTPLASTSYTKIPTVTISNGNGSASSHAGTTSNQSKFIRSEMIDVPAQQASGSTLPLVLSRRKGGVDEEGKYNPFENREVAHPTSDFETVVHLLKGSLGSGIMAVPMAFMNAGLWFGLISTAIVGFICTYCVHLLVQCAHILCFRRKIPKMGFADVAEQAFLDGSPSLQKWSRFMRFIVNLFLTIDLLGCCCIYLVFVARNVKQVVDFYAPEEYHYNVRLWILAFTVPMLFMCLVRNLKFLTPFSLIANILLLTGLAITCYYIFSDLPSIQERPFFSEVNKWPLFFGTVIFALEGIGVVMSLENDMKNPTHFIGCPSVLNVGMIIVVILYSIIGFFGYLKYGEETQGSVTLNLPVTEPLAQAVKFMLAGAIYFTFTLQFYVPNSIIWQGIQHKIAPEKQNVVEYFLRILLVVICGLVAAALPNLGPFISLIGAVCLSTLGLIVPPIIHLVVFRDDPGYGCCKWRLLVNIMLIISGIIGLLTGTYVSILEFVEDANQ